MILKTLLFTAALGAALLTSAHAEEPRLIPQSVRLFEARKAELPRANVDLSLCKLLARGPRHRPFKALPADRGPETCDLRDVLLAYNGFCAAGVEDLDVHFSQPIMPVVEIVEYRDGIVVYLNHILKEGTPHTPEGEAAVVTFLQGPLPAKLDIRGASRSLFGDLEDVLPLRKGTP